MKIEDYEVITGISQDDYVLVSNTELRHEDHG